MKKDKTYQSESIPIEELLTRLIGGEVDALDMIYRRYYKRLIYYGLQLTGKGHGEDIEDIVQEAFIWIAKNYDKLGKIRDFEAYLFQSIRRNIFLKLNLTRENHSKFDRFLSRTAALREHREASSEDDFIREETEAALHSHLSKELDKLPPYLWEVLYLRYYEGRSYKQIANILSIRVQVARNFASRGIKRLKKQFMSHKLLFLLLLLFV